MTLNQARLLTAMITPFRADGTLAIEELPVLIEYLLAHHTEGLVVAGTTGESPTLTEIEKLTLFEETVRLVAGRVPIICGVGSNDTLGSVRFIKKVAQIKGIDAGLCVVPYYNKPNQEGLFQHFKALSEASELPIMLYNVPSRTSVSMSVETTIRLSHLPNIIGTKDCQGLDAIAKLIDGTPDDFLVYSGEDHQALPIKMIGATGIISVSSHVLGDEMYHMYEALSKGDLTHAGEIHRRLVPKYDAVFSVPSPSPIKAILAERGLKVGAPRLPLVPCTQKEKESILAIVNK